jgi:hypothetical protein
MRGYFTTLSFAGRLAGDPCGGLSKVTPRNIVLAPDRFTDVSSSENVEAKIERVGQLVSFEGKLNTKAETCKIVNRAMVYGLILNQDLSAVVRRQGKSSPFGRARLSEIRP